MRAFTPCIHLMPEGKQVLTSTVYISSRIAWADESPLQCLISCIALHLLMSSPSPRSSVHLFTAFLQTSNEHVLFGRQGVLMKVQTRSHHDYHTRTKAGSLHAHSGRGGGGTRPTPVRSSINPHPAAVSFSSGKTSTTTASPTTPPPLIPDKVMEREQERRLDTLHKACTRSGRM